MVSQAHFAIEKETSQDAEKKVSKKQKSVFILGDKVKESILVAEKNRMGTNSRSIHELTRDTVKEHINDAGTSTLKELFNALNDSIKVSDYLLPDDCTITIFSEWYKWSEEKDCEKQGLFLKKYAGITNNLEELIEHPKSLPGLCNAFTENDIIVVYNLSESQMYCSCKDLQGLKNKNILFRTIFKEGKVPTKFFNELYAGDRNGYLSNQTILIFDVSDLRQSGFNVQKGVSWDQLVAQTVNALKCIQNYNNFKAIVVCFDCDGCLLYKPMKADKSNEAIDLFFYPGYNEGDFVLKQGHRVSSKVITMQASLTYALSSDKTLEEGIKNGLVAMREITKTGFTEKAKFNYDVVAAVFKDNKQKGRDRPVQCPIKDPAKKTTTDSNWENFSITDKVLDYNEVDIFSICRDIVTKGKAMDDIGKVIPYLRYANFLTYDRHEIAQLIKVQHLFRSYIGDKTWKNPLSICVFGTPGSGKSFAVKQIVEEIDKTKKIVELLTFNMSQITNVKELEKAFHQIRDVHIKGKLPIAFFDEFDTSMSGQELVWLKHFLAPMQDGEFTEEGILHVTGRAIFIFVGGTCDSIAAFKVKHLKNKQLKVPDFVSRLQGHIDVFGPNDRKCLLADKEFKDTPFSNAEECNAFVAKFFTLNFPRIKQEDITKAKNEVSVKAKRAVEEAEKAIKKINDKSRGNIRDATVKTIVEEAEKAIKEVNNAFTKVTTVATEVNNAFTKADTAEAFKDTVAEVKDAATKIQDIAEAIKDAAAKAKNAVEFKNAVTKAKNAVTEFKNAVTKAKNENEKAKNVVDVNKVVSIEKTVVSIEKTVTEAENETEKFCDKAAKFYDVAEKLKNEVNSIDKFITDNIVKSVNCKVTEFKDALSSFNSIFANTYKAFVEVKKESEKIYLDEESKKSLIFAVELVKEAFAKAYPYKEVNEIKKVNTEAEKEKIKYITTKCKKQREFCCDNVLFMLRRAALLRTALEKKLNKESGDCIKVDINVLKAFMYVNEYLNGTRSLTSIVQTSDIDSEKTFSAACINTGNLDMYVDGSFEGILNRQYKRHN
ncbi:MAG: AAA family ATPase [Candidatus Bathyarchaeota archaeon]|uniref:AAA family ATPase n=1 Tax=Candidatus Bathycorpusculum sp. TaxID=2994959 RepID=UPI002837E2B8|nr:AAA family ATPase [Candidatus Termiticorpusculum sp.]MCL2257953.1 AAA family ATPase [Candidatus Termiticorpusculum sp.]MCL2291715.1 AAA family ATPase [Candidatus Termiticorpusculum sp.]